MTRWAAPRALPEMSHSPGLSPIIPPRQAARLNRKHPISPWTRPPVIVRHVFFEEGTGAPSVCAESGEAFCARRTNRDWLK